MYGGREKEEEKKKARAPYKIESHRNERDPETVEV